MKKTPFGVTPPCRLGARWAARPLVGVLFAMGPGGASAQVLVYEGNDFPEDEGWVVNAFCDPPRAIIDGLFQQDVAPCPGDPLPGGQEESLNQSLGTFVGFDTFLEWRAVTDGPRSEIVGTAPALMVIGGDFGTNYHFTFARDQIRLIRDNFLPILFVDLEPNRPYTYRLELRGTESYTWYVDGRIVDSGVPEGAFPQNDSAVISFRAKSWYEPSMTRWDYVRFGVIPEDASGDYDSDGALSLLDFYFVQSCLSNAPGGAQRNSAPSCRFTDFDADRDVDLFDFAEFANQFSG